MLPLLVKPKKNKKKPKEKPDGSKKRAEASKQQWELSSYLCVCVCLCLCLCLCLSVCLHVCRSVRCVWASVWLCVRVCERRCLFGHMVSKAGDVLSYLSFFWLFLLNCRQQQRKLQSPQLVGVTGNVYQRFVLLHCTHFQSIFNNPKKKKTFFAIEEELHVFSPSHHCFLKQQQKRKE